MYELPARTKSYASVKSLFLFSGRQKRPSAPYNYKHIIIQIIKLKLLILKRGIINNLVTDTAHSFRFEIRPTTLI